MTRRKFDSSGTRVTPVFNQLLARDPGGTSWLLRLLSLPSIPDRVLLSPISSTQPLTAYRWGRGAEKGLRPPRTLLAWLIQNVQVLKPISSKPSPASPSKRQAERWANRHAVFNRDPSMVAEALKCLERPKLPHREWYIFEGITRPDVYLETSDLVVVIEGKRTEKEPTTDSTWMPQRDQMLRHLDCAWEVRGHRMLLGFFIVDSGGGASELAVPRTWQEVAQATIAPTTLKESLPHRTPTERQAIADSFLGVTTWQQVCATFQLDYEALPDTIEEG